MYSNLVTNKQRHNYLNQIYGDLHPCYDQNTRLYTKFSQNTDFFFKDDTLSYSKQKDLDFNPKSIEGFKSFSEKEKNPELMTVQNKISFYLTNNLVPGFSHNTFDNFKKERRFQSPELINRGSYIVDKWYYMKKDDLTAYYEKFFLDKEVDKMRKKNAAEKESAKPNQTQQPEKKTMK